MLVCPESDATPKDCSQKGRYGSTNGELNRQMRDQNQYIKFNAKLTARSRETRKDDLYLMNVLFNSSFGPECTTKGRAPFGNTPRISF